MIRVGLTDDHEIIRQGMASLIKEQEGMRVLFHVSNGSELLDRLKEETKPDVILLDLEMPIVNGQQALKIIVQKYPQIKVLILSMHYQLDFINECVANGAHGYLSKDCDFEKIVDAIYAVVFKGFYFDEKVSKALFSNVVNNESGILFKPENLLDPVDVEIIQLICSGKNTKEVAEAVFLSERTVEGRRLKIYKKTNSNNIVELVVYAIKHNIFEIY